jgi:hypothetical protein
MMGYLTWQIAGPKLRKSEQEQINGMNNHPMHNSGNTASLVRQKTLKHRIQLFEKSELEKNYTTYTTWPDG